MNVTLLIRKRKKEVINRLTLEQMAGAIKNAVLDKEVYNLRGVYHLMKTQRLDDGQIITNWKGGILLPRVCFAGAWVNRKGTKNRAQTETEHTIFIFLHNQSFIGS